MHVNKSGSNRDTPQNHVNSDYVEIDSRHWLELGAADLHLSPTEEA